MPFLERQGAKLHYEVWGEDDSSADPSQANPIVLVNGHARPLTDFRGLGRKLAEGGRRRVLAYDHRGVGKTEIDEAFGFADMVSDLEALTDALGWNRFQLLGISMGGLITLSYAEKHSDRIAKMILVSTAARSQWLTQAKLEWPRTEEAILERLRAFVHPEFFARNAILMKGMAKHMAGGFAKQAGGLDGIQLQRQATAGHDLLEACRRILAPVLILHGREDQVIPPEAALELQENLPDGRLEFLEGTGHLILMERFGVFADQVEAFFQA